ncbi:MAG: hypothetical protein V4594_20940 [Bacteroidota bacterium]
MEHISTFFDIEKVPAYQRAVEKGRQAEKIETAKKLIKLKIPLDKIAEGTGLSIEEIKVLK